MKKNRLQQIQTIFLRVYMKKSSIRIISLAACLFGSPTIEAAGALDLTAAYNAARIDPLITGSAAYIDPLFIGPSLAENADAATRLYDWASSLDANELWAAAWITGLINLNQIVTGERNTALANLAIMTGNYNTTIGERDAARRERDAARADLLTMTGDLNTALAKLAVKDRELSSFIRKQVEKAIENRSQTTSKRTLAQSKTLTSTQNAAPAQNTSSLQQSPLHSKTRKTRAQYSVPWVFDRAHTSNLSKSIAHKFLSFKFMRKYLSRQSSSPDKATPSHYLLGNNKNSVFSFSKRHKTGLSKGQFTSIFKKNQYTNAA